MDDQNPPGRSLGLTRLAVAAAILLVIAVLAVIYYQHHSSAKTDQTPAAGLSAKKLTTPVTSSPKGGSILSINELGVRLQVPATLAGLTYTVTTAPGPRGDIMTVQFIMKSYSSLANQCAGVADKLDHPFANLSRAEASAPDQPSGSVMKRFAGYSVVNSGSSLPPGVKCKSPAIGTKLSDLDNKLTASLKAAFQTAQPL